ncbi:hypothetical protein RJT34_30794 [Clitoria ternatea]|uniref:Uncharacterized protein n=1 Tax=Clitoria ternatea TaxID=43366 RepID=A0AAN9ET40_CLITE
MALVSSEGSQRELSMKAIKAYTSLKKVRDALESAKISSLEDEFKGVDPFKIAVDGQVVDPPEYNGEDVVVDPLVLFPLIEAKVSL